MLETRRRYKRIVFSKTVLVVLILFVLVLGRATWNMYAKSRATAEKVARVAAEHQELLERQAFLEDEIERLSTEEGIEEEIRTRFGFTEPDERLFIVVDPKESDTAAPERKGFWARIRDFFIGD